MVNNQRGRRRVSSLTTPRGIAQGESLRPEGEVHHGTGKPCRIGFSPSVVFYYAWPIGNGIDSPELGTKSLPLLPLVLFVLPLGSLYHHHHNHACHLFINCSLLCYVL